MYSSLVHSPQFVSNGKNMQRPLVLAFCRYGLNGWGFISLWIRSTFHESNILSIRWTWVMRRNLSPISCRLLSRGTIMDWCISIVRLVSRRWLEWLSSVRVIVIEIWRSRFINVCPLKSCPLHIISRVLLGVPYRIWHINELIWLRTLFRRMMAPAVATPIVLTI